MTSGIETELIKAIGPLLGAVIGFLLAGGERWIGRKRRLRVHWQAIRAEMMLCKEKVETFRKDKVLSPLYRFPDVTTRTAFPILLSEGNLNEHEALAVGRYSSLVEDLNRGLDNAASHFMAGDNSGLKKEHERAIMKTEQLFLGSGENLSVFEAARAIVDTRLSRWWDCL